MAYNRADPVTRTKECCKCSIIKPWDDFYANGRNPNLPGSVCKECSNSSNNKAYRKKWAKEHPDKTRSARLKHQYGITLEDFNSLLERQEYLCAGCGEPFEEADQYAVDHDHSCCSSKHSCGECIRGILHNRCNNILGFSRDSSEALRSLALYLDRKAGVLND